MRDLATVGSIGIRARSYSCGLAVRKSGSHMLQPFTLIRRLTHSPQVLPPNSITFRVEVSADGSYPAETRSRHVSFAPK